MYLLGGGFWAAGVDAKFPRCCPVSGSYSRPWALRPFELMMIMKMTAAVMIIATTTHKP